jgi:hypothetical protein
MDSLIAAVLSVRNLSTQQNPVRDYLGSDLLIPWN